MIHKLRKGERAEAFSIQFTGHSAADEGKLLNFTSSWQAGLTTNRDPHTSLRQMWRKWPEQSGSVRGSKQKEQKQARQHLDVPVALAQGLQAELLGDFGSRHSVGQILLVAEHEQNSVTELILVQHALQLVASLADTFPERTRSGNTSITNQKVQLATAPHTHMQQQHRPKQNNAKGNTSSTSTGAEKKHLSLLSTTKIRPCVF